MSGPVDQFGELGQLVAALCDGEITPPQAVRLEKLVSESAEARQLFLHYLQLHGELYWDHAAGARRTAQEYQDRPIETQARPVWHVAAWHVAARHAAARFPHFRWLAAAVAVSVLVAVGSWAVVSQFAMRDGADWPQVVARLGRTLEAVWAEGASGPEQNEGLASGRRLDLRSGLAEVVFDSGAVVILEGPAAFEVKQPGCGFLRAGRATARVPPQGAGFVLAAPSATVIDLGTEFGVAVDRAGSDEVSVFAGLVRVQPEGACRNLQPRELRAGLGLRLVHGEGGVAQFQEIAADPARFVREIPEAGPGSVAAMRGLVARHPRLIHHYTFEGATPADRNRDRQGSLHLTEVVMSGGRGDGMLRAVPGFDGTTSAVSPHRGAAPGNTNGMALQSAVAFQPPAAMTVELLLRFHPPAANANAAIFSALATRDGRQASFFVAAVERGQLAQLLDAGAPWVETEDNFAFIPGHWYYLAGSFRVVSGQTRLNTYAANLTQGERTLNWLVRDQLVPGVPATSRLGIGKGFDTNNAHAYSWSGDLDEVAIYDAVLDRGSLEKHLKAIVGARSETNN